jgi:hypothetical protein
VAPRFPLAAWRGGLLITPVARVFGEGTKAVTAEVVVPVVLVCAAAAIVRRAVPWWM